MISLTQVAVILVVLIAPIHRPAARQVVRCEKVAKDKKKKPKMRGTTPLIDSQMMELPFRSS
jgi:hypothetical protein